MTDGAVVATAGAAEKVAIVEVAAVADGPETLTAEARAVVAERVEAAGAPPPHGIAPRAAAMTKISVMPSTALLRFMSVAPMVRARHRGGSLEGFHSEARAKRV